MSQSILKAHNLTTKIKDAVLHNNLSFELFKGEILSVVGASGAGKSILMRALLGLHPLAHGSISILGSDVTHNLDARQKIFKKNCGVLFQTGALLSSLTVLENVMLPLVENFNLSESVMVHAAQLKLLMVGLNAKDFNKYPSELSGGMTKRTALARALVTDPDILFLDEPTSGLDPIAAQEFDQLVKTLRQTLHLSIFMISHDVESLKEISDRIAVLVDRKLIIGSYNEIVKNDHPWIKAYFKRRHKDKKRNT